jgi:DNA polymerase III epsilon subunit-like protein
MITSVISSFDLRFVARAFMRFFRWCLSVTHRSMFAREELRRRFVKAETTLFRVRYDTDDLLERAAFLRTQTFEWEKVTRQATTPLLALKHHD